MSDITKTPKEELECKKKYLYEHSMFWECNDGSKCQILEEDVCDLLNELNKEFEDCEKLLDSKDDFIHKFKRDIEELGISIKLFEDDIATKDKKIEEQQNTITKLKELNDDKGKRIISLIRTNKTLKEENEQLKQYKLYEDNKRLQTIIADLKEENEQLQAQLREKEQDERLYANEIVKLNKEAKEVLDFKSLGGDY